MIVRKTLDRLADEYMEAIEYHDYLIEKYKNKLEIALRKRRDHDEILNIKRMLCELHRQRGEMIQTVYKLKNYYKFSGKESA